MTPKYKNEAVKKDLKEDKYSMPGSYGFDRAPILLFEWSSLFQSVISQAGTYMLTGKFHKSHCAIYKCEGGCVICGKGDLVLSSNRCYYDHYSSKKDDSQLKKLANLITQVVLEWDPNNPIDTMLETASRIIKVSTEQLKEAVQEGSNPFGGNALADFFDWNPFSNPKIDRGYERHCLVTFNGMTNQEVDQRYADQDLGKKLLQDLQIACKKEQRNSYRSPMCCSPQRNKKGELSFWINTGRTTQIDGWKTQAEIETFINSEDYLLIDKANF